ncbi:hypothetical protein C8F04DRAFT_975021 [Mycena alexandri]|uniref:Uncharacterized protein n=1 Tax=Mycena alexandri TaxID=1745969 RepID=A0AAD6S302_9AGAR|nr:hypothetical protein C8F04DRAFT_975021 [Mycena alexandri]
MGSDATEPASSQTHREGPANVDTSDDESGGRAVAVIRTNGARTRVRISKRNPVYGVVEGAMRGANTFDIVRTKMLRPMITSRVEASARFLRSASEIIERRLSNESGCWLYFSAQHLFATEPFLHYASPRILKEAKKDVEQITNHFNRVFHTLIAARNEDSKEMHKKLLAAQEKETTTQNALAASQSAEREATLTAATSQRQLELQAQEMEAQRLELEMWKARLKVAEQRRSDSSTS